MVLSRVDQDRILLELLRTSHTAEKKRKKLRFQNQYSVYVLTLH